MTQRVDVVIVGAGIAGISAAHHLNKHNPNKRYVILEQRQRIGGTWDLFRYPGIRSDSDMMTMGYGFRPWNDPRAISPGEEIRKYIEATAQEEGIDRHISFGTRVISAAWSSADACWTLKTEVTDAQGKTTAQTFVASFLFCCSGYYRYDAGYTPEFAGRERFKGPVIHPQLWPENLDYTGKRVVVIGSGATAITLVPSMAKTAAHVTMLQRSPTYVLSLPEKDAIVNGMRRVMPNKWAFHIGRVKNMARMTFLYRVSRKQPKLVRNVLMYATKKALGPNVDASTHFNPRYNPWEQRMCLVPDNDLFDTLREGRASVVTDEIVNFTETGIQLKSGDHLDADIIVTATGLLLQPLGGIALEIDGKPVTLGDRLTYKGVMLSGVPNLAYVFGYINASWTLRADMVCHYISDVLNHMDEHGYAQVVAETNERGVAPFVDEFSAGYVLRALEQWPKQGEKTPWRAPQSLALDMLNLRSPRKLDGLSFRARS